MKYQNINFLNLSESRDCNLSSPIHLRKDCRHLNVFYQCVLFLPLLLFNSSERCHVVCSDAFNERTIGINTNLSGRHLSHGLSISSQVSRECFDPARNTETCSVCKKWPWSSLMGLLKIALWICHKLKLEKSPLLVKAIKSSHFKCNIITTFSIHMKQWNKKNSRIDQR